MMGAATEKARLPRFSFALGIESCCEVDDLSCLYTEDFRQHVHILCLLALAQKIAHSSIGQKSFAYR